jgi:hypothetical protein
MASNGMRLCAERQSAFSLQVIDKQYTYKMIDTISVVGGCICHARAKVANTYQHKQENSGALAENAKKPVGPRPSRPDGLLVCY